MAVLTQCANWRPVVISLWLGVGLLIPCQAGLPADTPSNPPLGRILMFRGTGRSVTAWPSSVPLEKETKDQSDLMNHSPRGSGQESLSFQWKSRLRPSNPWNRPVKDSQSPLVEIMARRPKEILQEHAPRVKQAPVVANPLRFAADQTSAPPADVSTQLSAEQPDTLPRAVVELDKQADTGEYEHGISSTAANLREPADDPVGNPPDPTSPAVAMVPDRLVSSSGSNDQRPYDSRLTVASESWAIYLLAVTGGLLLLILMLILTVWRLVAKIPTTSSGTLANPHDLTESAPYPPRLPDASSVEACRSRTPVVDLANEPISAMPELASLFQATSESKEEQKQNQQVSILQTVMKDNLRLRDDLGQLSAC